MRSTRTVEKLAASITSSHYVLEYSEFNFSISAMLLSVIHGIVSLRIMTQLQSGILNILLRGN